MSSYPGSTPERSDYERMRDKQDRIERTHDDDPRDAAYEAGFEAGYAKRAELEVCGYTILRPTGEIICTMRAGHGGEHFSPRSESLRPPWMR